MQPDTLAVMCYTLSTTSTQITRLQPLYDQACAPRGCSWYQLLIEPSEEKGKPVKDAFSKVRLVIGDLDSSKLIEEEAAKADVVIRRSLGLSFLLQILT